MERIVTTDFAPLVHKRRVWGQLRLWLDLWYERRALSRLDRRMLADIGIDESSAWTEAQRPVWDVPRDRDFGGRYGLDI